MKRSLLSADITFTQPDQGLWLMRSPRTFLEVGQAMPSALLPDQTPTVTASVLPTGSPKSLDAVRALCHDLRRPLTVIPLLAGARSATFDARFVGITQEAQ
jgi:hypothetical protein